MGRLQTFSRFLLGVALAVSCAGARAGAAQAVAVGAGVEVERFHEARQSPLWFSKSSEVPASRVLQDILRRAVLDGLSDGEALAAQVQSAAELAERDPAAVMLADRILSSAWVRYVRVLHSPPAEFEFADDLVFPSTERAGSILARAADAPSLADHLRSVSSVNPIYAQLREAAWNEIKATAAQPSERTLANLRRIRLAPPVGKYIIVDLASAKLMMFESGQQVDSMRVVVGKKDAQTPLLASTIYYATFNPYWNVPQDLVRRLIAPRVLTQGTAYLRDRGYEVVSKYGSNAVPLAADDVDWKSVAEGKLEASVRQLPGSANSMGRLKFGFMNGYGIYLHDTPDKSLFGRPSRTLSNGCIRLEDAERLGRWLLGKEPPPSSAPDELVLLPEPVPIYVTYLTLQVKEGKLAAIEDVYGKDGDAVLDLALR